MSPQPLTEGSTRGRGHGQNCPPFPLQPSSVSESREPAAEYTAPRPPRPQGFPKSKGKYRGPSIPPPWGHRGSPAFSQPPPPPAGTGASPG